MSHKVNIQHIDRTEHIAFNLKLKVAERKSHFPPELIQTVKVVKKESWLELYVDCLLSVLGKSGSLHENIFNRSNQGYPDEISNSVHLSELRSSRPRAF